LALALMSERGYSETTMADIATAAGVSSPTLFRYFPSKAAVLWHGIDESARLFRAAFETQPGDLNVVDAVFGAYLQMLVSDPVRTRSIRVRTKIISLDPEGSAAGWIRFHNWSELMAACVAERQGISALSFEATVQGELLWAALRSAASAWATGDESDPRPIFRAAWQLVRLPER